MKQKVVLLAVLFIATALHAQSEETRTLELEGGGGVTYTLRTHPANAHTARDKTVRESGQMSLPIARRLEYTYRDVMPMLASGHLS